VYALGSTREIPNEVALERLCLLCLLFKMRHERAIRRVDTELQGGTMSSRLDRITDWEMLGKQCGFSATRMAEQCGISTRQLRWYFQACRGFALKKWLDDLRAEAAVEMLERGEPVKSIAVDLGFKQRSHFSKFFKRVTGIAPSDQWRCSRRNDPRFQEPTPSATAADTCHPIQQVAAPMLN